MWYLNITAAVIDMRTPSHRIDAMGGGARHGKRKHGLFTLPTQQRLSSQRENQKHAEAVTPRPKGPSMRLEQLEYLVAISKSRSLSEASKKLYVTQQSLGKSLANLEQEIGTTLVIRGHNGCYLTKDGMEVLESAKEILRQVGDLKRRYHVCPDIAEGLVVLCCPSVHEIVISAAIERFAQKMPRVNVTALAKDSYLVPDAHRRIAECTSEVIISIANVPDEHKALKDKINDTGLRFNPLLDDRWVVCISKNNPLAKKAKLSLRELLKEPLIIDYPDYPEVGIDRTTMEYYSKYGTAQVKKAVDNKRLLLSSIERNEYIGFDSGFYTEYSNHIKDYPGIVVRDFNPSITSKIGYLLDEKSAGDQAVQTFLSCLEEYLGEMTAHIV